MITSETTVEVSTAGGDEVAGGVIGGGIMMTVVEVAALVGGISTDEEVEDSMETAIVEVAVTELTVVEVGTRIVVITVERAGQLVTSGPQLTMVEMEVEKNVEVEIRTVVETTVLDWTAGLVGGVVSVELEEVVSTVVLTGGVVSVELEEVVTTLWVDDEVAVVST